MPIMNGLELVENVRADERFKSLPILMVTTRNMKQDIVNAMKAGVNNENMRMTYTYVSEEDFFTQTKDFSYTRMRKRSLILKEGSIYLSGDDTPIFGPELEPAQE